MSEIKTSVSEIINLFPEPDTISVEVNNEVKKIIRDLFKEKGQIQFFDVIQYLEKAKEDRNLVLCQIIAYYACNIVMNNKSMPNDEKILIINDMYREVYDIVDLGLDV